jgi:hypothetical protein
VAVNYGKAQRRKERRGKLWREGRGRGRKKNRGNRGGGKSIVMGWTRKGKKEGGVLTGGLMKQKLLLLFNFFLAMTSV